MGLRRAGIVAGVIAATLAAAAGPTRAEPPLDLNRWDDFMQSADSAVVATSAARDSAAAADGANAWFLEPARLSGRHRASRGWVRRFRHALLAADDAPPPCLCTRECWGCAGAESTIALATFHRDAERLTVVLLPREHCAVVALDGAPQGCLRLDLGERTWRDLFGLAAETLATVEDAPCALGGEAARALVSYRPQAPLEAKSMGVTGRVRVRTLVGADGRVKAATAIDGPELLRDAATECVRRWRFEPARCGGRPVPMRLLIPLEFE